MSVLENFERWKDFLGNHVDKAESMGMSHDQITNVATRMGEFLSDKVDPKNDQERLLKQMWEAGSEDERRAMASMMVKLSDKSN